ncbi:MAG TPA: aminotransferase class I/II-fold pyridoxal phosphate-dependent enzyme [Caulobacteraceae bacterium]|jgi:aspartate/methionine/tyrosine aminotransferase|nr:aminotransferase class I/II-fold pyridoxal phosphate-dependent enzyme [Caulobacteraceae bacterium]
MRAEIEPFQAIGVSRLAHQLKSEGRSILHMEFGQPSTGAPRAAIETAHRVLDTDGMGYWESPALRARIARRYADVYGLDIDPDRVVLTCGASPALVLALASTFAAGDRVALARPGYVAYRNTLKALHMVPVEIACGPDSRFQLNAAHIAALDPSPAGLIVASPANPTGTIIPPEELAAIAAICRERNIRIVSDEIYHGLSYVEPAHSMLEFAPDTLVINSFSKYFSMVGWRLGWLLAPEGHVHRARAFVGNLFLTAPSLSQHAGLAAMDARAELEGHVAVYRRNRELLLGALPALGLGAIAPPDGAFYIYADVGHLTDDSLAFCKRLLCDTGVATAPGVDFDPVEGRHFIRFSFAVSTPEVEEALNRLRPWFAAQDAVAGTSSGVLEA